MSLSKFSISIFVILALIPGGARPATADDNLSGFAVGPYLLDVTTDSATVAFHLNKAMPAKIRVLAPDGPKEFASQTDGKSHFIKVTGLESGSVYDYEVICADGEIRTLENDPTFQIRTAVRPGESFSFAVYGDPRPGDNRTPRYHREVVDQMILHEPAFCLVLGDMVDQGQKPELWEEFFRVESQLLRSSAIYPVTGDNDYADGKGLFAQYLPMLEEGYYRFEWAGVQFFALNAWDSKGRQRREELSAQSPQIKWLESELALEQVQQAPFRVVFVHDPVYISRGRPSDVLRQVWIPIFQKYKVDVVFSSWHLYERSQSQGITYVNTGGAGAELIWMRKNPAYPSQAEARRHHFCRCDVTSNSMTIRAIASDGTVLDAITLMPRADGPGAGNSLEREANRLSKEILINYDEHNPEIPLYLFSHDCAYCRKLLNHYLPNLAKENYITFRVRYFDISVEGAYELFLNAGAEFGRQGADIPAVFIGRSVIGGEFDIETLLPNEMGKFFDDPEKYWAETIVPFKQQHDTSTIKEEMLSTLTSSLAFKAGLVDALTPCALITVIFLISYLTVIGRIRSRVLYAGAAFALAVFLTQLVIGLAFFDLGKPILQDHLIAKAVNSLLLLFVVIGAGASFVQFVRSLKGDVTGAAPQSPSIATGANKAVLSGISCISGIMIAVTALACNDLTYIRIVTTIAEPEHRIAALPYLLSYNIAFTLPIVAVLLTAIFIVVLPGVRVFFTRQRTAVKLTLVVLFVAMTIVVVHNLRWL